ncbi:hypothetical protein BOFE_08610 (plasmid) [Candidatus Borrelia fainii]|uniref:Uncharacterized protein n=1 Tax=Candidatus Borrelia fainii TaxID=2518322 RepID=A0ABM8DL72_9SPIR|nr:hypothetical protein [Candidatus Borrelia fainii]BDU63321.1 hypothetical protein BOFE_08610 [Candidatus Borrelia fainii]
MISLLDKLLDIATKGINNTREVNIKKVIEEFNTQNPALLIYINESGVNAIMRSCIKTIMTNISRYFFNEVHKLRDNLNKARY